MIKIAFLPCKEYSKRLKKKNFKKINRKYCLDIQIEKIKKSGIFDQIYLSSESKLVDKLKNKKNVIIEKRRKEVLKKNTTINDLLFDFIKRKKFEKKNVLITVFYPLSIQISTNDMGKTISLIDKKKCYSSLIVTNFSHYPQNALFYRGKFIKKNELKFKVNELLADAGSMYCIFADKFIKYKNLITPKTKAYKIPLSKAIDVDTEDDFKILKKIYKNV